MSICPVCGLPKEACICAELAKTRQKVRVSTEKRLYGKIVTVVSGISDPNIDIKDIAKKLKQELACGGTIKNNVIELQGNHEKKVKEFLVKAGFIVE